MTENGPKTPAELNLDKIYALSKAKREELFEAMIENVDNDHLVMLYYELIVHKLSLSKITEAERKTFMDVLLSDAAEEILSPQSTTKLEMAMGKSLHPNGRLVPKKPSLTDYDMTRGDGKYRGQFGVHREDDDNG